MKAFLVLILSLAAASASDKNYCYQNVQSACKNTIFSGSSVCNAIYGNFNGVEGELQSYANTQVSYSMDYLLMSTHYGNYEKNRPGFEKLFRDLSDRAWNTGIELIKYITKRGGQMNFNNRKVFDIQTKAVELYELESMAKALDMEKSLAEEAFRIHAIASRSKSESHLHDPEVASYLEKEYLHKQSETIRTLAGYSNDLTQFIKSPDTSLAIFMFDEILQKNSI